MHNIHMDLEEMMQAIGESSVFLEQQQQWQQPKQVALYIHVWAHKLSRKDGISSPRCNYPPLSETPFAILGVTDEMKYLWEAYIFLEI